MSRPRSDISHLFILHWVNLVTQASKMEITWAGSVLLLHLAVVTCHMLIVWLPWSGVLHSGIRYVHQPCVSSAPSVC